MILTVLRSGGDFEPAHVQRLADQCRKFSPGSRFLCLSDMEITGVETKPLLNGWPGWWCKINCLNVPGPVLYMDLDTTVCGDLAPLLAAAQKHRFIALRDFNPSQRDIGSGLMGWGGDISFLFEEFARDPEGHMAQCKTRQWFGDQGFIDRYVGKREYWQSLVPGSVVSFKKHCGNGTPSGARVICFHGKPRPWDVEGVE